MKHSACALVFALIALPAIASRGDASAFPAASADGQAIFARVSPTDPNDPLFPPDQWPSCPV